MIERDRFIKNLRNLKGSAVMLRKHDDGQYETVFVTEDFARMMECSLGEAFEMMNGKGFISTTHPEDRVFERRLLRRRVNEEGGSELSVRKVTAKGRERWCNVRYAFIDDYGEHYIYCTYFDTTVLKEYEERLRSAYMNMGDNFYQVDERTLGMFRVNLSRDAIEDMQGKDLFGTDSMIYPYSEVMKKRSEHYPIETERRRMLASFDKAKLIEGYLAGRTQVSELLYSRRSNGQYIYVSLSASVTRHPMTGDVTAFITEKESNKEKVNETLLEKILSRQFDMVSYLANGQYGVMIGDASLIEKGSIFPITRFGDYRHYLDAQVFPVLSGTDEYKETMTRALSPETVEEELKAKEIYVVNIACDIDGETYYKRFDFYPVDKEAKFYIILKSDTTDIQKEQTERNEQLKNALEEAKQASVAKSAFLSRMSHEIRTPMNAIIGLDNIALKEPNLTPEVKDHLDKIGTSARYLLSLINDILDMSRIENGRMTLNETEFSLQSVLEQVNTVAQSQCSDRGLIYKCAVSADAEERYIGDDTKLKQVLINILGNAVKFTEKGGSVSLSVDKTAQYDNRSTLRFVISDTGIGMDEEYLPKIFEVFSQEDATNTSSYGGSGLGLAITKNIVEMLNGDITVKSEKGRGSEFTVSITLTNAGNETKETREVVKAGTESKADLTGCRILIAEDMLINAEIMKQLLGMRGMETEHAENGQKAVEMFESNAEGYFDAILMDVRMPVMDGLAATEAIRALGRTDSKSVPIIAMTANAFDEDVRRSMQAGMNAHLAKPVEPELLYDTLARFIGKNKQGGENNA